MERIVKETIETQLDDALSTNLQFGFWNDETEEFIPLTIDNAEEHGVPKALVDIMEMFSEEITERFQSVNRDLKFLGDKII
jgi:hypothetical protein